MSSGSAKKRPKRSPCDAPDRSIVDMEALLDHKLSQMEQKMQSKIDSMQSEMDAMKDRLSRVDELEERCKHLEDKCSSMGRSLKVLADRWEISAPNIPLSVRSDAVDDLVKNIKSAISTLKHGELELDISSPEVMNEYDLYRDDALLPYWQNLVDAIDLFVPFAETDEYTSGLTLAIQDIQLSPEVLSALSPCLKRSKKVTAVELSRNNFNMSSDGLGFVAEIAQSNPNLEKIGWYHNPINHFRDIQFCLEEIKRHPSIFEVSLVDCFDGILGDGYQVLCSLLDGNKHYDTIELESNNIRTMGDTRISGYLASNPPLRYLFLQSNNLDDTDARLIADALKHNTNLRGLHLEDNDITETGRSALENAMYDRTSLNSAARSNHTCRVYRLSSWNNSQDQRVNRRSKIYRLLSSRNEEGTNVHHLNMELDDDSLKLVPRVLESVHNYAEGTSTIDAHPLSIFFELLRGWKMPALYERRDHASN
ncbi:hypothetical protein ACHAXT_012594 [Thalassiosira profunda]